MISALRLLPSCAGRQLVGSPKTMFSFACALHICAIDRYAMGTRMNFDACRCVRKFGDDFCLDASGAVSVSWPIRLRGSLSLALTQEGSTPTDLNVSRLHAHVHDR